jgi:NAD(P)H-hydrate epimerase
MAEPADLVRWLPPVPPETHKWRAGVLVVGGSLGMVGAPLLVSQAAMRSGARIVWCAVPGADAAGRADGTEVIARALPASAQGALAGIDDDLRHGLGRFRATVLGPGLGIAPETQAVVRELTTALPGALVLDADGLNAFAGDVGALTARTAPTVLTPHAAEFERLLGAPVGTDRVAAARRLAERSGCVALLKGPGTVIAHPDGRCAVNPLDGPWLGTAGSGDVLSGIIAGFLARGLAGFEAAVAAALLHGLAADAAGPTGLVASDIVAALGRTLSRIVGERSTPHHATPHHDRDRETS